VGAIDRTEYNALVDDSGLNTDGTPWTKAKIASVILDPIDAKLKPFIAWSMTESEAGPSPSGDLVVRPGGGTHYVIAFDGATDEERVFSGALPLSYGSGGLTCELWVAAASATSGTARFQAAIERLVTESLDIDADDYASFQSVGVSVPATAGHVKKIAITFTNGAQMDSLAAGESFRLKVRRDADGTSGTDDIATDMHLVRVVLRES
jgi:hypothetical protein